MGTPSLYLTTGLLVAAFVWSASRIYLLTRMFYVTYERAIGICAFAAIMLAAALVTVLLWGTR